jgi:LAS superfamily LD-carboxypeptidase LdcB
VSTAILPVDEQGNPSKLKPSEVSFDANKSYERMQKIELKKEAEKRIEMMMQDQEMD